jgi:hypothetical protein
MPSTVMVRFFLRYPGQCPDGLVGIPYLRLDYAKGKGKDSGAKKFRTDLTLQVLLLHGYVINVYLFIFYLHTFLGRETMLV